jgi:hypothetical protein
MQHKTDIDDFSTFVASRDIESARDSLDSLNSWERINTVMEYLKNEEFSEDATANYILGDIHFWYEEWGKALEYYMKAATLGLGSAFLISAIIVKDHSIDLNGEYPSYESCIKKSTESGNVWAKVQLLEARRDESFRNFIAYLSFRFICPIVGLRAYLGGRMDNVRRQMGYNRKDL